MEGVSKVTDTPSTTYDKHVKEALLQGKKVLLVPEKGMGRKTHFAWHS